MASIIFYDHDGYHPLSANDPDILFVTNPQDLRQGVLASPHPLPIVCLCCPDVMKIIGQLQRNVLTYVCAFPRGHVHLGNDKGNIRDNVIFSADSDWKFQIEMDRTQLARKNGIQGSIPADLQILKDIVEQDAFEAQLPVENQSSSSETSDEDLHSGEAEEKED